MKNYWIRFLGICLLALTTSCASILEIFDEPQIKERTEHISTSSRCAATAVSTDTAAKSTSQMDGPKHFSYTYFNFEDSANETIDRAEITVQLCNFPQSRPYGMFYQIYMKIGGNPLYFGIQTDLHEPGKGRRGPGFIFSRWGTLNRNDVHINPRGGFFELGAHEGGFVGVRLPYEIRATSYKFELTRQRGNWYQLSVTPEDRDRVIVGSLRLTLAL